jgi:hypothetical protein
MYRLPRLRVNNRRGASISMSVETSSPICNWCDRPFRARNVGENCYYLPGAGVSVCWECADANEATIVKLHLDKLSVFRDKDGTRLFTESGRELPIKIVSFGDRDRKGSVAVRAEDLYGQEWRGKLDPKERQIELRPTRTKVGATS